MDYLSFITSSLTEAAKIAHAQFGKVSGVTKGEDNNQVLTQTDKEIGQLIISKIKDEFPDSNIIDEEAGIIDNHSDFTWVIDPIDGTSNFANGIPQYGIMLGLLEKDLPIAGGIAMPFYETIYTAQKNKGAYRNNQPIHATKETDLISNLVAYTIDGHQENPQLSYEEGEIMGRLVLGIRNLRASGSCFDVVMVAEGKYGGYINKTSKIWDNVAPHILLEEAGCLYTDFYGKSMDYSNPLSKAKDNFTFCAAPAVLHQQLQKIIHNPNGASAE